jgi:hypothetical protein
MLSKLTKALRFLKPRVKRICNWCEDLQKPFELIIKITGAIAGIVAVYKLLNL